MNILKYKHHVLRDSWGSGGSEGSAGSMNSGNDGGGSDASAYGGRYSGFDPNTPGIPDQFKGNMGENGVMENTSPYTPGTESFNVNAAAPVDQFTRLKELSDMFNKENPMFAQTQSQLPSATASLNQLVQSGPIGSEYSNPTDQNQIRTDALSTYGTETPNTWQKLGIIPGMTSAQFFNKETPAQRDERVGMISEGASAVGKAMVGAALPAPVRMALGAYNAYSNYQNDPNKDLGKAVATGLSNVPGYTGALANMYNGNYGAAVTGGLAKNGITGPLANMAGIGADYASGKNVAPSIGGLAGQFAGQSIGGPLGGMFGKSLGQHIGRSSSVRK